MIDKVIFAELIEEYLNENLKVKVDLSGSYDTSIKVKIELFVKDQLIAEDYDYYSVTTSDSDYL